MCINVKLYRQVFARLDIKLPDTVFTKDAEHTLARILAWYFDYILLRHPRIASTCRDTTVCR